MDQLRSALGWLKRNHFWVLTVLAAAVALYCWNSASGKLSKDTLSNINTVKAEFQSIDGLRNKPFHPNPDINARQLTEINKQVEEVKAIWDRLYTRQKESVLKWPELLSPAFRDYIKTRKFGDSIPRDLCENYRDYIDGYFESLPKRVGARVMEVTESGGMGRYGGGMGRGSYRGEGGRGFPMSESGMTDALAGQEDDYLVEWLDQSLVREELNFPTTPSAPRIWVTQENVWAYETLLDIIANTNQAAGADRRSNAAVRTILSLEVGRPAAVAGQGINRIEKLQPPASGGGEMALGEGGEGMMFGREGGMPMMEGGGMERGNMFMGEGGMMGGMPGGAPMSEEQEKSMLLAGRYVDANGVPMDGAGGMAAMSPEGGDPAAAAAPVDMSGPFKRLPVRMTLEMDQRWLTHLIAECASQPLQVEVREVRINPPDVSTAGGARGGIGYEGGGYRGGMGGMGGSASGSAYQPRFNPGEILTFDARPNLVTVVIQGIIYIFNEPDATLLQVPQDDAMAAAQ